MPNPWTKSNVQSDIQSSPTYLPRRCHLSRKKASKLVAGLQHGPVATNVGLRRERIKGLAATQRPRNAIHGKGGRFLLLQLLDQCLVLFGPEKGNQGAVFQGLGFLGGWGAELVVLLIMSREDDGEQ